MRYELKSIGVWSLVKISFFLNLVFGAIVGLVYAMFLGLFFSIADSSLVADEWGFDPSEMSVGILLIVFPIIFGIMAAFFQTLIVTVIAGLYNLFTRLTGGLILNLESVEIHPLKATPVPAARLSSEINRSTAGSPAQSVPPPPPPPSATAAKPTVPAPEPEMLPDPTPLSTEPVQPEPQSELNLPIVPDQPDNEDNESDKKQQDDPPKG